MKSVNVLWGIGFAILFPLFFQLSGNIYNSLGAVIDSGGVLLKLPLPISILACFVGIWALKNNYRRASLAIKVVVAMMAMMLVSIILAAEDFTINKQKVVLMVQIMLPVAGLILGQMIIDVEKIIPKAFLAVLLLLVPAQLAAGWMQSDFALTHYLYVFSIYQHHEFVPLILVCAYAFIMTTLWQNHQNVFYFLTPLMAIYVVASFSLLTIFAFLTFTISFGLSKFHDRTGRVQALLITCVAVICMLSYFFIMKNGVIHDAQYTGKYQMVASGETPRNLEDRFYDWKLYGNGIIESVRTSLIGHPAPFPRAVKSSAHNWYLDMAYNFGLISWLPIILLIGYTSYLLWKYKGTLLAETFWLAAIVFYLVVIDSNFKVTLRQPYPGIFAYFLWGILLSVLLEKRSEKEHGEAC